MLLGLTWAQLLGLSGVAAIVGALSNLVATWLKDYYFARSLEGWKDRQALAAVYAKYRDPILLAAQELESRVVRMVTDYPVGYLTSSVLAAEPAERLEVNSVDDEYYKQYQLLSTHYRLCSLLGWLELYRQELTFLDTGVRPVTRKLQEEIEHIRNSLADGTLNDAPDYRTWGDQFIFREEQRAVGENMIVERPTRSIIGFSAFRQLFYAARKDATDELWWLAVVTRFLLDAGPRDFRHQRFSMLARHLNRLIKLLEVEPRRRWTR